MFTLPPRSPKTNESSPRSAAGTAAHVTVLNPHGTGVAASAVPADKLLYTRALERLRTASATFSARLCRHFERHGSCDRGENCRFIHRAAVSPPTPSSRCTSKITPGTTDDLEVSQRGPLALVLPADVTTKRSTGAAARKNTLLRGGGGRRPREPSSFVVPASSRVGPAKILTSRGWRHAAYDALPRSEARRL